MSPEGNYCCALANVRARVFHDSARCVPRSCTSPFGKNRLKKTPQGSISSSVLAHTRPITLQLPPRGIRVLCVPDDRHTGEPTHFPKKFTSAPAPSSPPRCSRSSCYPLLGPSAKRTALPRLCACQSITRQPFPGLRPGNQAPVSHGSRV